MSFRASSYIARKVRSTLLRVLDIDDVSNQIAALDAKLDRALNQKTGATTNELDAELAKNIFTSLQRLTDGLVTLDKRLGSDRTAHFLAQISEIHPKDETVLFAGGNTFGDNVKYAYLGFLDVAQKKSIACSFLPNDPLQYEQLKAAGLPCLPYAPSEYTPLDIRLCLSAKILVLDNHFVPSNWKHHLPHALLAEAKTIQLWHGIPIKEIGLKTISSSRIDDPSIAEILASCGPFDVFIGTNAASRNDWERQFSFRAFAPIGYPRNDVLLRNLGPMDKINVDLKTLADAQEAFQANRPVVLYAPTFRDYKGMDWFEKANITALAEDCAQKGILLFVNLHPCDQDLVPSYIQKYPKIRFITPHTDIYPVIKNASILITDYSSLAFDYLLLDRPILFYRPDHMDYITRSRHLIKNHDSYVCGATASTVEDLIGAVSDAVKMTNETDPYQNKRLALREKLYDFYDSSATERLSEVILSMLEGTP